MAKFRRMDQLRVLFGLGITVLICLTGEMNGQQVVKSTVPVKKGNAEYRFPFAGGMNAPQFSNADLNQDGIPDVFVFDRQGYTSIPFISIKEGDEYRYEVDWSVLRNLPPLQQWALMWDFNKDGVEDLFTSTTVAGVQGVDVYRGAVENDELVFNKMGYRASGFDVLYFKYNQNDSTPLFVQWIDIPAIADVDNDGDTDILAFEVGGSYVHYFRNMAIETGHGLDTLILFWEDECWGNFIEDGFSEEITLSMSPGQCAQTNVIIPRHSGSTIAAYDIDDDDDMDFFVGDIASPRIVQLHNGGTPQDAWMTSQDAHFPSDDVSVELPFFVSPFLVDINHDGKRDFVAASNNPAFSENYEVAWYYRQDAEGFHLVETDLFVKDMLDFGSDAKPAFFDYNADGLDDILVGSSGYYCPDCGQTARDARLILLKNIGTTTNPAFEIVDDDYLGFSQIGFLEQTWEFAPAVGDLDSDGDTDLLIGDRNGNLFFLENTAGAGHIAEFAGPVYPYFDISVGQSSTPCIYDLNADGMPDILCGERTGNNDNNGACSTLNYFQNLGTPGNAEFLSNPAQSPNTQCLGRVLFGSQPGLPNYSAPAIITTPEGVRLLTGSQKGNLTIYSNIENNTTGAFDLEDADYGQIADGFKVVPALADIDADGYYEMLLGNERGGLTFYETDLRLMPVSVSGTGDLPLRVSLSPNPTFGTVNLIVEGDYQGEEITVSCYDLLGRELASRKHCLPGDRFSFGSYAGVVIAEIRIHHTRYVQRILKY